MNMHDHGVPSSINPLENTQTIRRGLSSSTMENDRLVFLAKLPVLLNSSLETERVTRIALQHIRDMLKAEMAAIYLLEDDGRTLRCWELRENDQRIEGELRTLEDGIVSATMKNKFPLFIESASERQDLVQALAPNDAEEIKSVICMPLTGKSKDCIGVIQMLNRTDEQNYTSDDVLFVEQFSSQVALAIDNARLYQEATQKGEELAKLDRRKNEMISVIAHEFRTPLNIIQNSAELVAASSAGTTENLQILSLLQKGVERMSKLISQVRSLASVQNAEMPVEPEMVNVADLFNDLQDQYRIILLERSLRFELAVKENAMCVFADKVLLTLALQNLIANAIRYTEDGGRIVVGADRYDNTIEISVTDTGIGIDASEIPLIFQKFYEVNDALNHTSGDYSFNSGGLGLGLAAVEHILTAHNTNINVVSEPGKGSRFSFYLPENDPEAVR